MRMEHLGTLGTMIFDYDYDFDSSKSTAATCSKEGRGEATALTDLFIVWSFLFSRTSLILRTVLSRTCSMSWPECVRLVTLSLFLFSLQMKTILHQRFKKSDKKVQELTCSIFSAKLLLPALKTLACLPALWPVYTGDFSGKRDFAAICKLLAIPQRFESPVVYAKSPLKSMV